jgi:hypothetical protein
MSLLTDTQGTPERVWSTVGAVAAAGGRISRDELWGLLNPRFLHNGLERDIGDGIAHKQAIGASVSLELLALEAGEYTLLKPRPSDYEAFSDLVHDHLCAIGPDDPDFLLFEGFAWMFLKIDQLQSLDWTSKSTESFASAIEADIGNSVGGELRYNQTKITAWRRWTQFLDLALEMPGNLGFQPCITGRVARELSRSGLARAVELPAREVLSKLAARMPYIDGGALQTKVAGQMGVTRDDRRVSRLLSMALRDLEDEGMLELRVRGDASGLIELAADDRPAVSVLHIVLTGAAS